MSVKRKVMVPLGRLCVTGSPASNRCRPGARGFAFRAATSVSYGMSSCVPQFGPSSPAAELVTGVGPVPSALTV